MIVRVLDPILVKIDIDIEGARRKLVQLKKEIKEVSSGQASAGAQSRFNPRNVIIHVPEDHPKRRKEMSARPSLRDALEALAREGATAIRIGDVIAQAMKRSFPVISGRQPGQPAAKAGAKSGQPPGSNGGGSSDFFSTDAADRISQRVTWRSKGVWAGCGIVPFGNVGQKNMSMKIRPNMTIARINKPMSSFGMTRPQ